MKALSVIIGSRIAWARSHYGVYGVTQAQLSKLSGISAMHISHFERGRRVPSIGNLIKLSKALGFSTDWLLGL